MKILMMEYAFNFVEDIVFYINENNIRSQKAVEKMGGERVVKLQDQLLSFKENSNVIYRINKKNLQNN